MKSILRLFLISLTLASLNAKTIFVDANASSATPDGNSWTRAFVTLQDALAIATTGDEIRVARGAYYTDEGAGQKNNNRNSTFRLIEGITINGGYPVGGGPRDPFTNPTILSGDLRQNDQADFIKNTDNAFNVLFADGTSTAVTTATVLDGLIIKGGGGNANSDFPNKRGGGMRCNSASPILNNCIIWNNRDSSGTTTEDSSIFNDNSNPTYSYCLIANLSKASLDSDPSPKTNFDPSDPLFTSEIDPASAPTIGGNLRLLTGSPALNVGDNNSNSSATDLAGNPRKIGTIDLGAYEGGFVTFTSLGFTNPSGDDNNNGVTNYGDYAAGGDPTAPNDPSLLPKINDHPLTLSFRNNAADVSVEFQTSTDLLNWSQMIESTDYNTSNSGSSTTGVRTTLTRNSSPGLPPRPSDSIARTISRVGDPRLLELDQRLGSKLDFPIHTRA